MNACAQCSSASFHFSMSAWLLSSLSPFIQLGTQAHGIIVQPTLRPGLPISISLF